MCEPFGSHTQKKKGDIYMRNILNKKTHEILLSREIKNQSIALRYTNEFLPQAKKACENGKFKCEIKLSHKQRKYVRYYYDILKRKGFNDCDIVVNKKSILIKWYD